MRRELLAGALLALVARGPWVAPAWRHSVAGRFTLAVMPSLVYERFVDVNGWSWADVGQRTLGTVAVEIPFRIRGR